MKLKLKGYSLWLSTITKWGESEVMQAGFTTIQAQGAWFLPSEIAAAISYFKKWHLLDLEEDKG